MKNKGKKFGSAALILGVAAAAAAIYQKRDVIRTLIEDTAERFGAREDSVIPVIDPDAAEVNIVIRGEDCPEAETLKEENAAEV